VRCLALAVMRQHLAVALAFVVALALALALGIVVLALEVVALLTPLNSSAVIV